MPASLVKHSLFASRYLLERLNFANCAVQKNAKHSPSPIAHSNKLMLRDLQMPCRSHADTKQKISAKAALCKQR